MCPIAIDQGSYHVILDKKNSLNLEAHNDYGTGLRWKQKEYIASAVLVLLQVSSTITSQYLGCEDESDP